MIQGSDFEDNGFRSANHFHDPISNDGWEGNESAIAWGLRPIGAQAGDESWSWNDAREYYFKGLTLPTKNEREEQWGKLFRALGQFMHLLQDQASPAHVRNDPHISFGGIGDTDGLHEFMESRDVATYVGLGIIDPDSLMLEEAHQTQVVPVANLFDRNQYTGSNPEVSLGGRAGLAEFANANFFSASDLGSDLDITLLVGVVFAHGSPAPPGISWRPLPCDRTRQRPADDCSG